jgi:hypothetical protein
MVRCAECGVRDGLGMLLRPEAGFTSRTPHPAPRIPHYRTTATPHGLVPTFTLRVTLIARVSTTEMSSVRPLAV